MEITCTPSQHGQTPITQPIKHRPRGPLILVWVGDMDIIILGTDGDTHTTAGAIPIMGMGMAIPITDTDTVAAILIMAVATPPIITEEAEVTIHHKEPMALETRMYPDAA
jgi:hypothetical protein